MSNQEPRITQRERELLHSIFYDREDLLLLIRNLFFGFELEPHEQTSVREIFATPEIRTLMRRLFLPELERANPIGQSIDLWMTLEIKDKDAEYLTPWLEARELLIEKLEAALKLLVNPEGPKVDLTPSKNLAKLIARNTFTTHIEQMLINIRLLAQKDESEEQLKERLKKNSSK